MKVFYVHWNEAELKEKIQPLKKAGYDVNGHWNQTEHAKFGDSLPDVFVFSLDRLPSHSKAIAEWVWEAKKRQHIPIIFEGGVEEKIPPFKQKFPKAIFVKTGKVIEALKKLKK